MCRRVAFCGARSCGWANPSYRLGGSSVWGGQRPLFACPATMLFQTRRWRHTAANVDIAPSAARRGTARCVPVGLLPAGRARAAAATPLPALTAPASAARLAGGRQRRRRRGLSGGTDMRGPLREAPGAAMCSLRAVGRRALLPAGPHVRRRSCSRSSSPN